MSELNTIAELCEGISTRLSKEESDKIDDLLKEVVRKEKGLQADINSLYKESKERQEKILLHRQKADEFEALNKQLNEQIESAKGDLQKQIEDLTQQNQELSGFRQTIYKQNRERFKSEFGKIVEHPGFEKIKDKIKLPEKDENNEFNFESLEDTDIINNVSKILEYKDLGLFGEDNSQPTKINPNTIPKTDYSKIDIVELAKKNPAEYKRIRDQKKGNKLFG